MKTVEWKFFVLLAAFVLCSFCWAYVFGQARQTHKESHDREVARIHSGRNWVEGKCK